MFEAVFGPFLLISCAFACARCVFRHDFADLIRFYGGVVYLRSGFLVLPPDWLITYLCPSLVCIMAFICF